MTRTGPETLTEEQRKVAVEVIGRLPHEELAELVAAFAMGRTGWDLRRVQTRLRLRVEQELDALKKEAAELRLKVERETAWLDGYQAAIDALRAEAGTGGPEEGDTPETRKAEDDAEAAPAS